jgi:hypothetical protein
LTLEIFDFISAHPRSVAAVLLVTLFLAVFCCTYAYDHYAKQYLPGWRPAAFLLLIGIAGVFCAVGVVVCLGIATKCWYTIILLAFPEILLIPYALCKSIGPALKMTAADCRKSQASEPDKTTKPE